MGKLEKLFKLNMAIISFLGGIISFLSIFKIVRAKKTLKRNIQLKSKKTTDKCFVLGLGPSLSSINIEKLNGDTIVVNEFYNFQGAKELSPTFYCMIDNAYAEDQEYKIMRALEMFPNSQFLLNYKLKSNIQKKKILNDRIYYSLSIKGFFNDRNTIDLTKNSPIALNVVCQAIILALYLDYKEIVLLGCDFNSYSLTQDIHCYEEENNNRQIGLAFELFCYSLVSEIHNKLSKYANKNSIKIINATPGSLIDSYEKRADYIFEEKPKDV